MDYCDYVFENRLQYRRRTDRVSALHTVDSDKQKSLISIGAEAHYTLRTESAPYRTWPPR
jgi:hypothetical protein